MVAVDLLGCRGYSGEDVSMKATLSEAIIVEEDVSSGFGGLNMSPVLQTRSSHHQTMVD